MILITRAAEGASKTSAALSENKIPYLLEPLLTYCHLEDARFDHQADELLVVTSSNAIRSIIKITDERDYTIITSGQSTADYAREEGFHRIIAAGQNVKELIGYITQHHAHDKLLYVRGKQVCYPLVDILLNNNIITRSILVYEMQYSQQLTARCRQALLANNITGIVFFSFNTAKVFINLVSDAHLMKQLQLVSAYSLSANITTILMQLTWKKIYTANVPTHQSLLGTIVNSQCYLLNA